MTMYLVLSAFTSSPVSLLVITKASVFFFRLDVGEINMYTMKFLFIINKCIHKYIILGGIIRLAVF